MKVAQMKEKLMYWLAIGTSIFLLFIIIMATWIGYEVKSLCQDAQNEYGEECVESLTKLLQDEDRSFKARNNAIWALGMIGDSNALPVLNSFYTGQIPDREPLNEMISQYELKK